MNMLDLQKTSVQTLELAINDIVNDMLYRYFGGDMIFGARGSSTVAKIFGVDAEAVADEADKRFDACIAAGVTRL